MPKRFYKQRTHRRKYGNKTSSFISSSLQTMGPGVATACCNGLLSISDSGIDETYSTSLSVAALGKPEYTMYTSMYKYMKINSIKLTFLPINYIDETGGMFFQVQWRMSNATDKFQVPLDDNSKFIGINYLKPKSFSFRPPNVTFTNFQYTAFNFREWLPTYVGYLNLPISIVYTRIGYNSFQYLVNVQFYMTFRGSNLIDIDSLKKELDLTKTTMIDRKLLLSNYGKSKASPEGNNLLTTTNKCLDESLQITEKQEENQIGEKDGTVYIADSKEEDDQE